MHARGRLSSPGLALGGRDPRSVSANASISARVYAVWRRRVPGGSLARPVVSRHA